VSKAESQMPVRPHEAEVFLVIWRLAWRNLWRNPRRTGIVVTAVAVGITGCLLSMAFMFGMVDQMVDTAIRTELGHLQVHGAGWDADPVLSVVLEQGGAEAIAAIDALPEVAAYTSRIRGDGLINSPRASAGARVLGVDEEREGEVSRFRDSIVEGDWFGSHKRPVVIGDALARLLKVEVGDKVAVSVQDATGDLTGGGFRIAGIFHTASSDVNRSTAVLRLADASRLLALGDSISELVIIARDDSEIDAIRDRLEDTLGADVEVRSWGELQPMLIYTVRTFDGMAQYLYLAVFIAMAFGIANVLLMAVHERTRELGMLRAVGMSSKSVVASVVIESLMVTGLGLLIGVAFTVGCTVLVRDGVDLSTYAQALNDLGVSTTLAPVLRLRDLVPPLVIGSVTALLSSWWPARRAVASQPAEALRHT
jgi:putative ABC transport system permease protein